MVLPKVTVEIRIVVVGGGTLEVYKETSGEARYYSGAGEGREGSCAERVVHCFGQGHADDIFILRERLVRGWKIRKYLDNAVSFVRERFVGSTNIPLIDDEWPSRSNTRISIHAERHPERSSPFLLLTKAH